MRCPDCAKMVSYGEPKLEVQNEEIDEDGQVNVTVRMVLPCGECGGELKDNEFELETQVKHECKGEKEEDKKQLKMDWEGFELELEEPEATDEYRPRKPNKSGKPIPLRYQTHYFGVQVEGKATCKKCGEVIDFKMSDELEASGFNELV